MSRSPSPSDARNVAGDEHQSLVRRSLHAVFSPFSPAALALLPRLARPARYTRADDIPDTQPNNEGQQPTIRDYHSINLPPQVRVPKKLPTPIRVEGKVWFANERSTYGLHLQSDTSFFCFVYNPLFGSLGIVDEHCHPPCNTFSRPLQRI